MASPRVRRRIPTAFAVLFFIVVADGLTAFGFFMVIRSDAAKSPTGERVAPIRDHGSTYSATEIRARVYDVLMVAMTAGISLVVDSGVVLEHLFHIPVLSTVELSP